MIYFTRHAKDKFKILKQHKFKITKNQVIETVNNPDLIDYSRRPLFIAQRKINSTHVLRVIYKKENDAEIIITFYPARRKHYKK